MILRDRPALAEEVTHHPPSLVVVYAPLRLSHLPGDRLE